MLDKNRLAHMNTVAENCYNIAIREYGLTEKKAKEMFFMGLNHDIGYAFGGLDTHNEWGYLMTQGSDDIRLAIKNHGLPETKYSSIELDILNKADLTANSRGAKVTAYERLKDLKLKHTTDSDAFQKPLSLAIKYNMLNDKEVDELCQE